MRATGVKRSFRGTVMRLAGIAIVRNECDIVEAFMRHNATILDRLYVIDNGSSDATPEILRRMTASGLPIKLGHDGDLIFALWVKVGELSLASRLGGCAAS